MTLNNSITPGKKNLRPALVFFASLTFIALYCFGLAVRDHVAANKLAEEFQSAPGCGSLQQTTSTLPSCQDENMQVTDKYETDGGRSSTAYHLELRAKPADYYNVELINPLIWSRIAVGNKVTARFWENEIRAVNIDGYMIRTHGDPEYKRGESTDAVTFMAFVVTLFSMILISIVRSHRRV
jgi:hypothetical protein